MNFIFYLVFFLKIGYFSTFCLKFEIFSSAKSKKYIFPSFWKKYEIFIISRYFDKFILPLFLSHCLFVIFTNGINYLLRFCVVFLFLVVFLADLLGWLEPAESLSASLRILFASSPNTLSNLLLVFGLAFASITAFFLP